MNSRTTRQFRKLLQALPPEVQQRARNAYRRFQSDPSHGSLRFKCVHPNQPIYSVRISKGYRAVGKLDGQGMLWFWIGGHDDYEQLLHRV